MLVYLLLKMSFLFCLSLPPSLKSLYTHYKSNYMDYDPVMQSSTFVLCGQDAGLPESPVPADVPHRALPLMPALAPPGAHLPLWPDGPEQVAGAGLLGETQLWGPHPLLWEDLRKASALRLHWWDTSLFHTGEYPVFSTWILQLHWLALTEVVDWRLH